MDSWILENFEVVKKSVKDVTPEDFMNAVNAILSNQVLDNTKRVESLQKNVALLSGSRHKSNTNEDNALSKMLANVKLM